MATKAQFNKTEKAHQDAIFKVKGREPTNYGADVNDADRHESWITSKLSDGKVLHTHHDHKTGKVTHTMSEELDEAKGARRYALPLKGHPYHAKSDAELHYIIRDASDAAQAIKGHSPKSEGKYLDQANDAQTILGHRRRTGQGPIKTNEDEELDEAGLVSKKTLQRYRDKSKKEFRAKGGINAALEKQDKEKKVEVRKEDIEDGKHPVEYYDAKERDRKAAWHYKRAGKTQGASLSKGIKHDFESQLLKRGVKDSNGNQTPLRKEEEQIDELDRKTLKSYQRKASTSSKRAWDKSDKEEDKAMSTDGYKYPEKQARHQANANAANKTWNKRQKGLKMSDNALRRAKATKEGMEIIDTVMVTETPEDASSYIAAMEVRMNDIVSEIKNEMKVSLFDFAGIEEARKPKPGSPGGSWVPRDVADRFKKQAKEKKQFAGAKKEIDRLKKQGK